jgi:hypothetical protein
MGWLAENPMARRGGLGLALVVLAGSLYSLFRPASDGDTAAARDLFLERGTCTGQVVGDFLGSGTSVVVAAPAAEDDPALTPQQKACVKAMESRGVTVTEIEWVEPPVESYKEDDDLGGMFPREAFEAIAARHRDQDAIVSLLGEPTGLLDADASFAAPPLVIAMNALDPWGIDLLLDRGLVVMAILPRRDEPASEPAEDGSECAGFHARYRVLRAPSAPAR